MSRHADKMAKAIAPGPQITVTPPHPPPMRWTRGVIVSAPTPTTCTLYIDGNTKVAVPAARPPWSGGLTAGTNVEVLISGNRAIVIG